MVKPVTAYAKKRANENEVISSTNFRIFWLLFPIFTVGVTFLARTFVNCSELTLHAYVTFNFRHNRFYFIPFRHRFSFFNDVGSNRTFVIDSLLLEWRCRLKKRAEANYSLGNLLLYCFRCEIVTLNWLCRTNGRWLRNSFRCDCTRWMTYRRREKEMGYIFFRISDKQRLSFGIYYILLYKRDILANLFFPNWFVRTNISFVLYICIYR